MSKPQNIFKLKHNNNQASFSLVWPYLAQTNHYCRCEDELNSLSRAKTIANEGYNEAQLFVQDFITEIGSLTLNPRW